MFEKFTDPARLVVVLAQEEARLLNHHYIGTEHILLGLIRQGDGVAARVLEPLGVSLSAVREQLRKLIGQGMEAHSGFIPFTPRAQRLLEASDAAALAHRDDRLGDEYIETGHILLGLISEPTSVGALILAELGGDLDDVRQHVTNLMAN